MPPSSSRGDAALAASTFLAQPPATLPAVIVAAGAERWFREQVLATVVARVFPDGDPGGGMLRLNARDPLEREQALGAAEELRSGSLFGAGRVVVVEQPEALGAGAARTLVEDEDGEEEPEEQAQPKAGAAPAKRVRGPLLVLALEALEAAVAGSVLVLATQKPVKGQGAVPLASLTKAGALVVDCRALYDAPGPWERGAREHEHELARHLVRRASVRFQKALGQPEAHALTRRVGSQLGDLEQALETLALHAGASARITLADLDACFVGQREDAAWSLVDAVLDQRAAEALTLLESALAQGLSDARGSSVTRPEALFALLGGALHAGYRRVLAGAEALARGESEEEVVRAAGLPAFRAERHLARCRRDPRALLALNAAFLEAERGVKGGSVPAEVALTRLVCALTAKPPAGARVPQRA